MRPGSPQPQIRRGSRIGSRKVAAGDGRGGAGPLESDFQPLRGGVEAGRAKMPNEIILLSRSDIESLMPFGEYVDAVAEAFRLHAEGRAVSPAPLHIPAEGGGFHVKSASLPLGRRYVAIKTNSNFPQNRSLRDLPTIQGAILLLDADDGTPLAFLDSMRRRIQQRPQRPCPGKRRHRDMHPVA
jgi:hypothetical protein